MIYCQPRSPLGLIWSLNWIGLDGCNMLNFIRLMCRLEGRERHIVRDIHTLLHISWLHAAPCCSEMWELLQTDTNGDSCPGRGKNMHRAELRWSFESDIKNILSGRELRSALLQSVCSGRLQSRHCSHSHWRDHCLVSPGNRDTRLPRWGWTLLNLLISVDFQRI